MTKRLAVFAALVGLAAISFAQDRQPRGTAETMVKRNSKSVPFPTLRMLNATSACGY